MKNKILAIFFLLAFGVGLWRMNGLLASLDQPTALLDTGDSPSAQSVPVPSVNKAVVTGEFVNVRDTDGKATGEFVERGQLLAVRWLDTGWGVILAGDLQGLRIWRGCTDQAAGLGCEAK